MFRTITLGDIVFKYKRAGIERSSENWGDTYQPIVRKGNGAEQIGLRPDGRDRTWYLGRFSLHGGHRMVFLQREHPVEGICAEKIVRIDFLVTNQPVREKIGSVFTLTLFEDIAYSL
jgi:hypothetical protein